MRAQRSALGAEHVYAFAIGDQLQHFHGQGRVALHDRRQFRRRHVVARGRARELQVRLGGGREMTQLTDERAQRLVAQRADHLRMAYVTAFANVDFPSRQLERRVRPNTIDALNC